MTWEQRYRLWHAAGTSLVPWAALSLVAALVCAPVVRWLDQESGWTVFRSSPDGARAVLGTLVGSMLTFIVFVRFVQRLSVGLRPTSLVLLVATVRATASVKENVFTVLSSRDVLPEVERLLTHDPRLARCSGRFHTTRDGP